MASIISAGTTSATALNMSADTTGVLQLASNNGTVALTVSTSQLFGFGTTSPQRKVTIVGPDGTTGITEGNSRTSLFLDNSGANYINIAGGASSQLGLFFSSPSTNNLGAVIYDNSNNFLRFDTNGTERGRFDSAGRFAVGLTDPNTFSSGVAQAVIARTSAGNNTVALALVNNSGATGTSVSLDFNPNTNVALAQIKAYRTDSGFGGATELRFLNYNGSALAERMLINPAGNLLINTSGYVRGTEKVSVAGGTNDVFVCTTEAAGLIVRKTAIVNSYYCLFENGGTITGSITANGASQVLYNTSSDYRLKENIAPMTGALEKVAQLKPCTYTWKTDGSAGQGFIAHELQAVVPDCVSGQKDEVETVEIRDKDGNVIGAEEKPVYQGVDTSYLVATLTAAIQELSAKVTALENK